jgi:hypothetical protein
MTGKHAGYQNIACNEKDHYFDIDTASPLPIFLSGQSILGNNLFMIFTRKSGYNKITKKETLYPCHDDRFYYACFLNRMTYYKRKK